MSGKKRRSKQMYVREPNRIPIASNLRQPKDPSLTCKWRRCRQESAEGVSHGFEYPHICLKASHWGLVSLVRCAHARTHKHKPEGQRTDLARAPAPSASPLRVLS